MEAVAKVGGTLMVATAVIEFILLLCRVVHRRVKAALLDREFLVLLQDLAASAANREAQADRPSVPPWSGTRKFHVAWREYETPNRDICSFYLMPCDDRPIRSFAPGQFLTLEARIPGQAAPITRCYSLSDSPTTDEYYRITVKRIDAPPGAPSGTPVGMFSSHLFETAHERTQLDIHAPAGNFCLDESSQRPIVLIAGGVGITPLLSMLNWLHASGADREVWLFYGVTNRHDHPMQEHFRDLVCTTTNFNLVTFYSNPTRYCMRGVDYDVEGFVCVDVIMDHLAHADCDFYVCGPPAMMDVVTTGLLECGVPQPYIRTESFGPATPPRRDVPVGASSIQIAETGKAVTFARSNKTATWTARSGSLLELAEATGVKARFTCRSGNCGTCIAAVTDGEIEYEQPPAVMPEDGYCLPCIARPVSDLTIEL